MYYRTFSASWVTTNQQSHSSNTLRIKEEHSKVKVLIMSSFLVMEFLPASCLYTSFFMPGNKRNSTPLQRPETSVQGIFENSLQSFFLTYHFRKKILFCHRSHCTGLNSSRAWSYYVFFLGREGKEEITIKFQGEKGKREPVLNCSKYAVVPPTWFRLMQTTSVSLETLHRFSWNWNQFKLKSKL